MRISPLQIGLLLAGLIILGGLLYAFLLGSKPKEIQQTEPIHSTVEVTPIHSDVSVKEGSADFVIILGQQAVESGSRIKTSEAGRALIESASSHITRLDYSSEIIVEETEKRTQVSLAVGAVWSRLLNVFDSGETYEVQTPNAIATVRGTSFGVWYSVNTTILIVTEGEVLFTPIGAEDKAVIVRSGYKATRTGTGPVKVESLTKADRLLPWVLFNATATAPPPASGVSGAPITSPAPQPPATPPQTQTTPTPTGDIVRLSGISPITIVEGSQEVLTISGRNLDQVETLTVGGVQIYFTRVNTTTITAPAPVLVPGRYSVSITAPGGRVSTLSGALTVTARAVSPNTVNGKP